MKFVKINMNDKMITTGKLSDEYMGLGGRGLTSIMLNEEVPAKCDPLGPENKIIFAPGSLSGTNLVNVGRISVGSKSPLTGGIKESNAGGTISTTLSRTGLSAIIIEGCAPRDELYILKIDKKGNTSLLPAEQYRGFRTYKMVKTLLEEFGKKNSVMCIGPAGEYKMLSASIQASDTDNRPCRAAARGGLGAVMGSKGIKAIIVEQGGTYKAEIADVDNFKKATKDVIKAINADHMTQTMKKLGTASLVAPLNMMGGFSCFNARKGVFDGWEQISGEAIAELTEKRGGQNIHQGCSQCIVHCSNVIVDENGKYITSSLEYETIWAFGGMLGIKDVDLIAKMDFMCDDIGVDTMNTGVAIAVAMDSGYASFGDMEATTAMMKEIAEGTAFGYVLGNGPSAVGEYFGNPRVPAVKRQSVAAYDPRAIQGQGVTYSTTPMGADHTAGNMIGHYLGKIIDPSKNNELIDTSRSLQTAMAAFDCVGMCFMAAVTLLAPEANEAFRSLLSAMFGKEFKPEEFPGQLGERILKAEMEFNRKAGLTKEDDRLPEFYYKEPLPPYNRVFEVSNEELDSVMNF